MILRNMTMYVISNFICPCCGGSFPLPRMKGQTRNKGHVKDLWCPNCKKIVKTTEIRDRDVYRNMAGEILY